MPRAAAISIAVVAIAAATLTAWTMRKVEVPRQNDALTQYEYARTNFFDPGFRAQGAAREHLLTQAIEALQAVVEYFKEDRVAVTTRALAEYDTGVCYRRLGQTERAREAFLRVKDYVRYADENAPQRLHPAGRNTLRTLVDAAEEQLRQVDPHGN